MSNTNKEAFSLSKVKLHPNDGGLDAAYSVSHKQGEEISIIERQESSSQIVHPDLKLALDTLKPLVAQVFDFPDAKQEKIEIRGLAYSGSGSKKGVVITSVYETVSGKKVALNTPRILVEGTEYGFEETLAAVSNRVKDEVYAYLFEGKSAQLSLFGEE